MILHCLLVLLLSYVFHSHPLFIILELLFEKCERATRGEETPSSTTYDGDIQEFVRRHESSLSPIFIDNVEIDNLVRGFCYFQYLYLLHQLLKQSYTA